MFVWFLLLWSGASSLLHNTPPEKFASVKERIPTIHIDSRYHGTENFTGAPLPGYGVNDAWLRIEVIQALAKVQQTLATEGLGLLIYDAYRPQRATKAMMAWAKRTNQWNLIDDGYIATRSRHNHGVAVDLTLINLSTGEPLDMGTEWDEFSTASHTKNASGEALHNRLLLQKRMKEQGFTGYSKEWWHFNFSVSKTTARDIPYSCFEPKEGEWKAPPNWENEEYAPPRHWTATECLP